MDPAHVVLLLGVFIAVAAIAGYLIAIVLILRHVVNRLVTILGAVEAVTETSRPVGPIVDDINKELDAGRRLIEDGVKRLEESRVPVGAVSEPAHPSDPMRPTEPSPHPEPPAHPSAAPEEDAGTIAPPPLATDTNKEDAPGRRPPRRGWWNR